MTYDALIAFLMRLWRTSALWAREAARRARTYWGKADSYLKITIVVLLLVSLLVALMPILPGNDKPAAAPPRPPVSSGPVSPGAGAPPEFSVTGWQIAAAMVATYGWGPEQTYYLAWLWRDPPRFERSPVDMQKGLDDIKAKHGSPHQAYLHHLKVNYDKLPPRVLTSYDRRAMMVADAKWAVKHKSQFTYAQVRPIPLVERRSSQHLWIDCSGFVTLLAYWAGVPDPNGQGYNGSGYTGTLISHLKWIPKASTKPGDVVVIGWSTGTHAVMLIQGGNSRSNPLVVSMGGAGDPSILTLSTELSYFASGSPVYYLRVTTDTPVFWTVGKGGESLVYISKTRGVPVSSILKWTLIRQGCFTEWQSHYLGNGHIAGKQQPGMHWSAVKPSAKLAKSTHHKAVVIKGLPQSLKGVAREAGQPISTILRWTLEEAGSFSAAMSHYLQEGDFTKPLPQGVSLIVGR